MIGVLLLAQWLVAAYACPVNNVTRSPSDGSAALVTVVAGCHGTATQPMDPENAVLCKVHCTADEQAPAQATPDDVTAPVLGGFMVVDFGRLAMAALSAGPPAVPPSAAPPGWPPLYLIHQVFRN
jgi:hypothetical protein